MFPLQHLVLPQWIHQERPKCRPYWRQPCSPASSAVRLDLRLQLDADRAPMGHAWARDWAVGAFIQN